MKCSKAIQIDSLSYKTLLESQQLSAFLPQKAGSQLIPLSLNKPIATALL